METEEDKNCTCRKDCRTFCIALLTSVIVLTFYHIGMRLCRKDCGVGCPPMQKMMNRHGGHWEMPPCVPCVYYVPVMAPCANGEGCCPMMRKDGPFFRRGNNGGERPFRPGWNKGRRPRRDGEKTHGGAEKPVTDAQKADASADGK